MTYNRKIQAEFCVVGGGLAGISAALAAARHGIKTVLMHDRPVPGGNASSEIRMWVCGARGQNNRESGIIEEFLLENLHRNPGAVPSLWDSVLYGALEYAPNLELLLNTSCQDVRMTDNTIAAVRGYQLTTQTTIEVEAALFADCSGDSVLAPLTGARFRHGREAAGEFDESIEPETADSHTMGSSCLIQARELNRAVPFIAPEWAQIFSAETLPPHRFSGVGGLENFWWIEVGGLGHTIRDAEVHRRELLEIAFGVWDYLKNRAPDRESNRNWELEWVGFLPGKRESRRYVGDYMLHQRDIESSRPFADIVAYGGWPIDDHPPGGFFHHGPPTFYKPIETPFGIPYRCLYSADIGNLFCAGRNISVTHAALSSTRVMATCATLGQAVGTAAAIARRENILPREVGKQFIGELQQTLLHDDCYLPGVRRTMPALTCRAMLSATNGIDPEPLRDGCDRVRGRKSHAWQGSTGDSVEYRFLHPETIGEVRIILDSDLNRPELNIVALRTLEHPQLQLPETLLRDFDLDYENEHGNWQTLSSVRGNYRRMFQLQCGITARAIRFTVRSPVPAALSLTGFRIFAFELSPLSANEKPTHRGKSVPEPQLNNMELQNITL